MILDSCRWLLNAATDRHLTVRVRASWALANWCDEVSRFQTEYLKDIPMQLIIDTAQVALKLTQDNEKVARLFHFLSFWL
jgi:hypothetical protein